jgi:hypothetical protein
MASHALKDLSNVPSENIVPTNTAVNAAIATDPAATRKAMGDQLTRYTSGRSMVGLKLRMMAGRSAGMAIVGDSTGTGTNKWPAIFYTYLKTLYPNYGYKHEAWSGTAWSNIDTVAPPNGELRWVYPTDGERLTDMFDLSLHRDAIPTATNSIAIELKASVADWSLLSGFFNAGVWHNSVSQRLCAYYFTSSKTQTLNWYDTNGDFKTATMSTALPYGNGDVFWIRVELVTQDGGNSTVTFKHRATDSASWTTLGSPVTVTTTYALRQVTPDGFHYHRLYAVRGVSYYRYLVYNQTDPTVGAMQIGSIDDFDKGNPDNRATLVGSPIFTLRNASVGGWTVRHFRPDGGSADYVPINKIFFNPNEGVSVCMVNHGHNHSSATTYGPTSLYVPGCSDILTEMQARFKESSAIYVLQNPQNHASAETNLRQTHRVGMLAQRAANDNRGTLNAHMAFIESGIPISTLLSDTVHPSATGYQLWADVLKAGFDFNAL